MLNTSEPAKKESSKRLAVQSFILACVGLALVVLFVVFGSMLADNVLTIQNSEGDYSFPVLSFVGAMILYALALIAFLTCVVSSISFAIYQRRLNKLKIGNVSLIISLVSFALSIIATILIVVLML